MIRSARPDDIQRITDIYNHYVLNSTITFEEVPVSPMEMSARLQGIESRGLPWLVTEENGIITGFAYASTWKARHAYRFTVEITIYLSEDSISTGRGSDLYKSLFDKLRSLPVHAAVACIALPNLHSVALHEKFGMKKVAHFNEVGFKFDRWLDVGYWQINL
ncbi:MAG: N-acetyltransferase family protein [Pseudomonadota bacterium]